jgi:glyoxylase-like metal-dependent hydrolase (beta-lactamase superfamily II)
MKGIITGIILAALLVPAAGQSQQDVSVTVTQLTDKLYLLSTDQGSYTTNTIAFVGDDGILLVDTQSRDDASALKAAVDAFGKGMPKYIINTHRHIEHIGGNAIFGTEPVVIAHALVPAKLRSRSFLFEEFPPATFPDITVADSLTLYFNSECIRIVALSGSHDDNEIIIHFTDSKIVHLSSIVNGFNFPSVDSDGDVLRFPELVTQAVAVLPHDVVIISGHNDPGTWDDLRPYHDMLVQSIEIVQSGLAAGKDLTTLQQEHVLDRFASYAGSYVSVDQWIAELVDGLQKGPESKPTVFQPLYDVWKSRGAAAAVARYFELKRDHPDEYQFAETTLLVIGIRLLGNDHLQDAVAFLEASVREHPNSELSYYAYYELAEAHHRMGQTDLAKQYCERSLELNPTFEAATTLLEELTRR